MIFNVVSAEVDRRVLRWLVFSRFYRSVFNTRSRSERLTCLLRLHATLAHGTYAAVCSLYFRPDRI